MREGVTRTEHGRGVFLNVAPPPMRARQRRETLRPLARRLAVEGRQLGAGPDELAALLEEEIGRLNDAASH